MVGQFARSIAGHDKGNLYIIIGEDKDSLILSDGRLKKVEKPKKKNRKHIQIIKKDCNVLVAEKIANGDKAVNEAIKRAIKLYEQEDKNV